MATFKDAASFIRAEYQRIWNSWFGSDQTATPATLDIRPADCSAGYSYKNNRLLICICEGNLDDFDSWRTGRRSPGSRLGWYVNQRELIHEMLHEYQNKRVSAASLEGAALHAKYCRTFAGPGHDDRFFTAIAEKAAYFGVPPEELIAEL